MGKGGGRKGEPVGLEFGRDRKGEFKKFSNFF